MLEVPAGAHPSWPRAPVVMIGPTRRALAESRQSMLQEASFEDNASVFASGARDREALDFPVGPYSGRPENPATARWRGRQSTNSRVIAFRASRGCGRL